MSGLIPFHGGLTEPVNCNIAAADVPARLEYAQTLDKLQLSDGDVSMVYRLGDGGLSPLNGPMDYRMYNEALYDSILDFDGTPYAWTIPFSIPASDDDVEFLRLGEELALTNSAGDIVAILLVADIFRWHKDMYLNQIYGSFRTDNPGAEMFLKQYADKEWLLGGGIKVFPQPKNPSFGQYVLSPLESRKRLAATGWDRIVAFQTRNPLHRAHEYALVYGLESLLRAGYNAGACLNPLVGETKGDDVNAEIRMKTYEALIENRSLGEGDSDPELWKRIGGSVADRVLLMGLDMKMYYGGPREAVMHAIYRQNYGFTDIIIGRKHADVSYNDGTPIWGDFDAQEIFNNLKGRLDIKPLNVGFAAYYDSVGRVDLMENHPDEKPVFISGKEVRKTLVEGNEVDPRIMRPSTSRILADAMKQ